MLSSVCEVTSCLDWWLSTCGGFHEQLIDEALGNFERLMLSGSRALEFLGNQGDTALGNLVLSRRDFLLLDVRSTVPAEEVARLCYTDLPSSPGIFPCPLLVQRSLQHRRFLGSLRLVRPRLGLCPLPLLIVPVPPLWYLGRRSRRQRPSPLPPPRRVGRRGDAKGRRPFRGPPAAPAVQEGKQQGARKKSS